MSYIYHHAIIVTGMIPDKLKKAHSKAKRMFKKLCSPIITSSLGADTFIIVPDGSKEGWDDSDKYDILREEYMMWLGSLRYEDGSSPFEWLEVLYGDYDSGPKVIDSDKNRRKKYVSYAKKKSQE